MRKLAMVVLGAAALLGVVAAVGDHHERGLLGTQAAGAVEVPDGYPAPRRAVRAAIAGPDGWLPSPGPTDPNGPAH